MTTLTGEATKASRSPRKAKGHGHLRRAEILEAAQRIFLAEGYEGATIRKIAEKVGVSSTALYMHFEDKSSILLAICEQTLTLLLERNRELAAKPLDCVQRVRTMLEAYVRWGLEHPSAYLLVYCVPRPPEAAEWSEVTMRLSLESYEIFAGVVREIADAGHLRAASPDTAAQVLWMSCHGLVALLTARPGFGWADREELIQVTLDGLIAGLVVA